MVNNRPQLQLIGVDARRATLANALLSKAGWSSQVLENPAQCLHAKACRWLQQPSQARLQAVLDEAITVLEHSRQSFRSRDLAALRQRLQQLREQL